MQYDADKNPCADTWLELDERERIELVIDCHRRTRVQLESPEPHAIAHVVVENQVALGEATRVPETLYRLMDEGLDRHDAVHAIASILMSVMSADVHRRDDDGDLTTEYNRKLTILTAVGWRSQFK